VIKGLTKAAGTLLFYRSTGSFPVEGDPMRRSQRTGFPVADEYKLMPTSLFTGTDLGLLRSVRLRGLLFQMRGVWSTHSLEEHTSMMPRPVAKVRILHFKYLRHSNMASVLITTSEIFTRVSPNNSLERLTERSVGIVTDRPSDVYELFVTLL